MRIVVACLLAILPGLPIATAAQAASCDGIAFPDQDQVDGTALTLNGLGLREATIFNVSVYVAALYLEHKTGDADQVIRVPEKKRLVLHFVRDVDGDDIADAFREGFEKNAGAPIAPLEDRIKQLSAMLTDVKDGQSVAFTVRPGAGLTVETQGATKGTIAGDDFAQPFLAIWFGPKPPNKGLKTGLLGGACG